MKAKRLYSMKLGSFEATGKTKQEAELELIGKVRGGKLALLSIVLFRIAFALFILVWALGALKFALPFYTN